MNELSCKSVDELIEIIKSLEKEKSYYKWNLYDNGRCIPIYDGEFELTVETLDGFAGIKPGVRQTMKAVFLSGRKKFRTVYFEDLPQYYKIIAWKNCSKVYEG